MGNLPAPRVTMSRPFRFSGVDYAGPVEIKESRRRNAKCTKGYIAIFVCLCTKAIHIELVSDLTSHAFIAAFNRLVSRRGHCQDLYSDCGTNFVGANNIFIQEYKKASETDWKNNIVRDFSNMGTNWHFIPPASPHFGGLWEAGVKSTKQLLSKATDNIKFTFEEFNTLLTQIEACLNSRPLCPMSNDQHDFTVLTPSHFLIGESIVAPLETELKSKSMNSLNKWQHIQRLKQQFWKQWTHEYLVRLQQRPKWKTKTETIKEGDLVLIKDERMPPTLWPLARIEKCYPGLDGLIRAVDVLLPNKSTLKRPIVKICPLPCNNIESEITEQNANQIQQ